MIEESDELIVRAARALSGMPPTKAGAVARVLMAVRANQARPLPFWKRAMRRFDETSVSAKAAGLLMAASLVIGFFARGTVGNTRDSFAGGSELSGTALQSIANMPAESRPVPVAVAVVVAVVLVVVVLVAVALVVAEAAFVLAAEVEVVVLVLEAAVVELEYVIQCNWD